MRTNTKLKPLQSTTFDRLRTSLGQVRPPDASYAKLLAAMTSTLDLLESPHATEAQLKACHRTLERAEQATSPWAPTPRPSRAKATLKLAKVVAAVLLIQRFAVAPMSAATVRQVQLRMPQEVSRTAVLKAIQRRRARQVSP